MPESMVEALTRYTQQCQEIHSAPDSKDLSSHESSAATAAIQEFKNGTYAKVRDWMFEVMGFELSLEAAQGGGSFVPKNASAELEGAEVFNSLALLIRAFFITIELVDSTDNGSVVASLLGLGSKEKDLTGDEGVSSRNQPQRSR